MNVNELLQLGMAHLHNDAELVIPTTWSQGRTVYGGISTALLYQALADQTQPDYQVRSLNINFVGPLFAEKPCHITVSPLRVGKNVAQYIAYLHQGEHICVVCQGCFTRERPSKIDVDNRPALPFTRTKSATFLPQIPKVVPKFLQHFDLAIQEGGIPFTGRKTDFYKGWFRYKDLSGDTNLDQAAFIGLLDAYPPTLIQLLKWPAPASTINWNLEFLAPLPEVAGNAWFAYQDLTVSAKQGYGATEATIWSEDGECLVLSRQTVGVFDG